MKLNKWIFNKIKGLDYLVDNTIPSEEDIEMWIMEWYESVYERKPPMWLASGKVGYEKV
jgi:hypothetical protein